MIIKEYGKNNLTYNMYSEHLINQIIDSVVKDKIMVDFYCDEVNYIELFYYRINKKFGGIANRLQYREDNFKEFYTGANLIIPLDEYGKDINIQEYLMYKEIATVYKEIKKYTVSTYSKLLASIEREDSDREYIYSKRLESNYLKNGFKGTLDNLDCFEYYEGILSDSEFYEFVTGLKNKDYWYNAYRSRKRLCFKGKCVKAPVLKVLGLEELYKIGMEKTLNDYQKVYIDRARIAILMDMQREDCLNEIKLTNGVIYEEKDFIENSEVIRNYLEEKIEAYKIIREFDPEDYDNTEYDNKGMEVYKNTYSGIDFFLIADY